MVGWWQRPASQQLSPGGVVGGVEAGLGPVLEDGLEDVVRGRNGKRTRKQLQKGADYLEILRGYYEDPFRHSLLTNGHVSISPY